jgi:hypothetical protein
MRHAIAAMRGPERFPAKWRPVRVKKTRQNKNLEPRSDAIGTEKALLSAQCLHKPPAAMAERELNAKADRASLAPQNFYRRDHPMRCRKLWLR